MAKDLNAPKNATQYTKAANDLVKERLPFNNTSSYRDARQGVIEQVEDLVIEGPEGPVWSLVKYRGQMGDPPPACPETVNPSLWRQATLNSIAGLFSVVDGFIYQVRAFDMSNMTIIEGNSGLIIIDPLISTECAAAALDLYRRHRGNSRQVTAVIYTHSHADHFGGVRGVISDEDVKNGVQILAPVGFLEHAVSENVYAGTAMVRRAQYMYGPYIDKADNHKSKGQVDGGLGKGQSTGTITLIAPTLDIDHTGQKVEIDKVKIEFQLTPGSEAPAEMNFYFEQAGALCTAENTTHNMHNIQTLRGARVRDALLWSKYLNEAINDFGDKTEVLFAQHHWPVWGKPAVDEFLRTQRDMYRFLNDQTLRFLNKGYTGIEIAETFQLPPRLDQDWSCRGYYGTVSHNTKAVYDRYMGWFNGNPSTLHALPPTKSAPKYVEAMGGRDAVMTKARAAFEIGEYRWVAELLGHLVFAEPTNVPAAQLQADALEQLGYQAEAATWRNFYLMGAQELREGIKADAPIVSPDIIIQLTNEMVFDMLGSKLDGLRAAEKNLVMNWTFTDVTPPAPSRYLIEVSNGALSCSVGKQAARADVVMALERSALDELLLGQKSIFDLVQEGRVKITEGGQDLLWFLALIDEGDPNFAIVKPKHPPLPVQESRAPLAAEAVNKVKERRWEIAPPVIRGC